MSGGFIACDPMDTSVQDLEQLSAWSTLGNYGDRGNNQCDVDPGKYCRCSCAAIDCWALDAYARSKDSVARRVFSPFLCTATCCYTSKLHPTQPSAYLPHPSTVAPNSARLWAHTRARKNQTPWLHTIRPSRNSAVLNASLPSPGAPLPEFPPSRYPHEKLTVLPTIQNARDTPMMHKTPVRARRHPPPSDFAPENQD